MARKIMSFLIMLLAINISAFAQEYSISLDKVNAETAIARLQDATGYDFVYQKELLKDANQTITANFSNASLTDVLNDVIVDKMGLSWKKVQDTIILSNAEPKSTSQKSGQITGTVVDSNGDPLTGVAVLISGTRVGALTDLDGNFSLNAPAGQKDAKLFVSMVGMKKQEVEWKGKPLTIHMEDDSHAFDEVVVTGYQVINKRALTSAVTTVKAEDIMRPDAMSIDQMLEGQVPDLMFMSNSGEAGVAPKIRIRGTSSIIGNREPLWVVDGIVINDPVPISVEDLNDPDYINRLGNAIAGLNPQDIERLDVLKDASATALYGTKAANGVIVITTKRGHEGKPTVRYNNSFTFKRRPHYTDKNVDVMNSLDRIQISRELYHNAYKFPDNMSIVGYEGALLKLYNGTLTPAEFADEIAYIETVNTDWFDLLTHDSFSQQHTVSLSGGSERGTYYASVGITDNDDTVKGTKNKRYSAMVNLDTKFNDWFSASFGMQGYVQDREYYQDDLNPVDYAYTASRAIPAYDRNGRDYYYFTKFNANTTGHRFNIINELENSSINQDNQSLTLNANLKFRFTDWLSATATGSYTASSTNIQNFWGDRTWYAAELRGCEYGEVAPSESLMPQGGQLTENNVRQRSWTTRLQLDWNKYFGEGEIHNFSGGIGFEASSVNYKGYANVSRGYYPDRGMTFVSSIDAEKYPSYAAWAASNTPTLSNSKSNTISGYITASYSYNRMVYVNANARVDGSNNFGDRSNDKLLPIWSVSGSFNFAQLPWLREQVWLDFATLKASYGYQGNMLPSESPVMIIKKNPLDSYFGEFTSTVTRNPNPDLKWEKTTSWNFGLEAGFFDSRLQLEANLYFKRTKDAFMTKTISTVNGYSSYVVNGGNISNDGFSLALTVRPIQTKDWQWSITGSFSRTLNSVESLPAGESYELDDFLNGNAIVKGKPVGTFYSYKYIGLSPVDGGPMFDDGFDRYQSLVGLSKYDTYTSVLEASGSREPYMQGSFNTSLRYKSIRLSANFNYSLGAKTRLFGMYAGGSESLKGGTIYNAAEIRPEYNLSNDYLDRWMQPGDELHTGIPAIIGQGHPSYFKYRNHWSDVMSDIGVQKIADSYWDMYDYSNYRVASANYLKLSSLSLSWTVPDRWLRRCFLERLELTATGNNLHTWCDKKLKGQTPTQGGFTTIQLSDRPSYSFGLSVTF